MTFNIQHLNRAVLESLPRRSLHQARNWSKAQVYEVAWPRAGGQPVVVKDLAALPLWFRVLAGRGFLRRETRALRALREVEGVPSLVERVDRDAIAMEKAAGTPLSDLDGRIEPQVLGRIADVLAQVHARGVAHGDLHASNVLVDESGRVSLIDWATSCAFGGEPRGARRWSFEEWRALDRRALAKLKALHAPALVTPQERHLLLHGGSRLYRAIKRGRRQMDRLRGKKSGAKASALDRYLASEQGPPL